MGDLMTDTTKLLDEAEGWINGLFAPSNITEVKTILAALRFAKAMQPRPISEAPRDGTPVLIYEDDCVCEARFKDGGWWELNNDPTDAWGWAWFPTHFTPLPDQALKELEEALR